MRRLSCGAVWLLACGTAAAQTVHWSSAAPTASPPARRHFAMDHDLLRQRTVLFGGVGSTTNWLGDTWEWNGATWQQRLTATSPPARTGHAMAFHAPHGRMVMFGGRSASGTHLTDTWTWDGTTWAQAFPATTPPGRFALQLAYDAARQQVVMFGGVVVGAGHLGDTWTWDGTNWLSRSPAASPSPRASHAMAYDQARQRVVLFGGDSPPAWLNDTWEWDGTNWTLMTPTSNPPPRRRAGLAFHGALQRTILFGGQMTFIPVTLGDTWEWDGATWVPHLAAPSPAARVELSLAYDSARQQVVLFGGLDYVAGTFQDTWTYGPSGVIATATPYGSGCGSPVLGCQPDASGRPLLGQVGRVTIVNCPTAVGIVAMGGSDQSFGPQPLPMTLAGIGMPGCSLLQSNDFLGLPTSPLTPGALGFALPIPNVPSLLGAHAYLQAYVFAPGANPLHVLASNAIDWLLGNQ